METNTIVCLFNVHFLSHLVHVNVLTNCIPFSYRRGQHTIAIYGEHDKFVPMSPQRVTDIIYTEDDMVLQLVGVPSEKVVVSYLLDGMQKNVTTVFSTSRTAHISLVLGKTKHVTIAHQRPFTESFNGFGKRGV